MTITRGNFITRKNEITSFLENLDKIKNNEVFTADFLCILYSNALLMIYNLVEATVVGGIVEIYDAVKDAGETYHAVSSKVKDIWFDFKFKQAYDPKAHHNSYKKKASQIIDEILTEQIIELNRHAINAEGNLTSQIIRNICDNHGIHFTAPQESKGGVKIDDVTTLRNQLAHGEKSFVECGRDFDISDLTKTTYEIERFLEGLLEGMSEFYNNQQWKAEIIV